MTMVPAIESDHFVDYLGLGGKVLTLIHLAM